MSLLRRKCCCGDCWIRPELCTGDEAPCIVLPMPGEIPRPPLVKCQASCEAICAINEITHPENWREERVKLCLGQQVFTLDGEDVDRIVFEFLHPGQEDPFCYYFDKFFSHEFLEECPPDDIPVCKSGPSGSPPTDPKTEWPCLDNRPDFFGDSCMDCCESCLIYCLKGNEDDPIPCQHEYNMMMSVTLIQEMSTCGAICNCINQFGFLCNPSCGEGDCDSPPPNCCCDQMTVPGQSTCDLADGTPGPPGFSCPDPCESPWGARYPQGICSYEICLDRPTVFGGFCQVCSPCTIPGAPAWLLTNPDGGFGFAAVCAGPDDSFGQSCASLATGAISCDGRWHVTADAIPPTRCGFEFGEDDECFQGAVGEFIIFLEGVGNQNRCVDEVNFMVTEIGDCLSTGNISLKKTMNDCP